MDAARVNTNHIVSAVPCESRGVGPWTRINLVDETHMVVQGKPDQFKYADT